ncbi:hypothetical protein [Cohnella herbarum]|nr:hypothetical protein [Cohnella herbarum]
MGWLDESYGDSVDRALIGVMALIESDGTVQGVSGGTPVMPSIQAYDDIPCYPTLYGQGLTLILLSLAIKDKREKQDAEDADSGLDPTYFR